MAANKRKQDEKHLKILREMVALPHNKQCFDCHQRGPTYVNMTTGAFVCTSCSGMLRGLNPPHRVKSISMTSFTTDEMEFLKARGNEFCRKVWLGLYDSRSHMEPDSKDETKIKDFMCQKYEKKRWYVAPTEAMHEEARKQNTPEKKEVTKPLRTLTGDNIPGLKVLNNQTNAGISKPVGTIQKPVSRSEGLSQVAQPPSSLTGAHSSGRAGVPDLLGELGNDPFANPSPAGQTTTPGGGFADFSSFNSQSVGSGGTSGFPGPPPAASNNAGLLQPLGTSASSSNSAAFPAFTATSAESTTTSASNSSSASVGGGGDRYAALADLDSVFGGGVGGGGGGSGGFQPTSQPPASSTVNWMGASTPGGTTSTSVFGAASSSANSATGGSIFGAPVSNPFGAGGGGGGAPPAAASVSNPFMAGGGQTTQAAGFAQFGQTSAAGGGGGGFAQFGQTSAAAPSSQQGFGGFGQTQTSTAAPPGGQFGMQNGTFGVHQQQQAAAGWGMPMQGQVGGFGATGTPSQAGMGFGTGMPAGQFGQKTPQQGFGVPQSGGIGGFGGWGGQQPVGNPFMSVGQQQAIPPRSNSTNPFL